MIHNMNKTNLAIVAMSLIFITSIYLNYTVSNASWWGDSTKGEPQEDVWQESCMPVLIHDHMTCQQANYIIKQNARMIQLMENKT